MSRKMIRVSKTHHDYIESIAKRLSKERGSSVSMTQALAEILHKAIEEDSRY